VIGRRALPLLLAALVIIPVGCGDPYAEPDAQPAPTPGEVPGSPLPKPAEKVKDLAATPEQAARRAAELTTNWTGETAASHYADLARFTIGGARRAARESAARLPTDPQLSAPGARNSGTVEAIVPRTGRGRRRDLIVVTRETLTADGLRRQRWRVTLATAEQLRGGWVLSRWEPQP
jgi:hypothetical protein